MIQKKICMLGASAVGKTSLVSRFVRSLFSDKYHTTVGVKVDKKTVALGQEQMDLLLWDLYGEDEFQKIRTSYLRGSAGYVLVVDGTRRETLEKAVVLQNRTEETLGKVPFVGDDIRGSKSVLRRRRDQRCLFRSQSDTGLAPLQAPDRAGYLAHLAGPAGGILHEGDLIGSKHKRFGFQDGLSKAWKRRCGKDQP